MSGVFISYARKDGAFARGLAEVLRAHGKEPWVDTEGIGDGEVFPDVLRRAIEQTDALVFVISEHSAGSRFCRQEVEHAARCAKRIVPILHRPVPDEALPPEIRDRQWVQAGEHLGEQAAERLIRALDHDAEHVRRHTRFLVRAREWEAAGRGGAGLPRGEELAAAERWLTQAPRHDVRPTSLHTEWIAAGRLAQERRRRRLIAAGSGLLLVVLALLGFALLSRHDAVLARAAARSRELAREADSQLAQDPQRALLLARAALAQSPTPEAALAVSNALDANTVRSELPSFGAQGCLLSNYMYLLHAGRIAIDNTCGGDIVFGDIARRRIVRRIPVGAASTDMTLSPDARTAVVATGSRLVQVDLDSLGAQRTMLTAPFPVLWIAHAPIGAAIAIGDYDRIAAAAGPGSPLRTVARGDASANPILGMFWAAPDRLIVIAGGVTRGAGDLPPGVSLLDVATGRSRPVALTRPPAVATLAFLNLSPDRSTWYFTGSLTPTPGGAPVSATWAVDARTRRVRWTALGPAGSANPVQGSADGRLLGVGYGQGAIDVLDAQTGRLLVRETSSSSIVAGWMAFPPGDDPLVTVTLDGIFRTWTTHGNERLHVNAPGDPVIGFTPDGENLVLAGRESEVVSLRSGSVMRRMSGFPAAAVLGSCTHGCISATAGVARLSYVDPFARRLQVREIDGRTGRRLGLVRAPRLDAQAVAPDGRIAIAYVDGDRLRLSLHDGRTDQVIPFPAGPSSVGCTATIPSFTPDGRWVAIVDGCLRVDVWDVAARRLVRSIELPDRSSGTGAQISPDGRYVLVAVEGGGLVRAEVASGSVQERPGSDSLAGALLISPDDRFYAVGRQDGTIDVYAAQAFRLVRHHILRDAIVSLAFSPDARLLAAGDATGLVRVWDTCAICQNPQALAERARRESVRSLTPGERATFHVN